MESPMEPNRAPSRGTTEPGLLSGAWVLTMDTRRDFIKKSAILCAAATLPVCFPVDAPAADYGTFKTREPKTALVLYYSQTGFTRRYALLISCLLKERGLKAEAADILTVDKIRLADADLIVIGSPVFYYSTPTNVTDWIETLPPLTGVPVAAFVSYGGPEGNQKNAVSRLLCAMVKQGGVPAGTGAFMNMASYPPDWDAPRQIAHRHLPDEGTYNQVRRFVSDLLAVIDRGQPVTIDYELALREMLHALPLVWLNKKAISRHEVDGNACIMCMTCVKTCPVDAIDPLSGVVKRDVCLACFGCLNNCPADAVVMEYRGRRLDGFKTFLKKNTLSVSEPPEFQTCGQ